MNIHQIQLISIKINHDRFKLNNIYKPIEIDWDLASSTNIIKYLWESIEIHQNKLT